jgi:hypothetical protein
MSPIWLSPEPAPGLTGGQAQRHADLEGDVRRERARVETGESVLVLGASGGVGQASVQLAMKWVRGYLPGFYGFYGWNGRHRCGQPARTRSPGSGARRCPARLLPATGASRCTRAHASTDDIRPKVRSWTWISTRDAGRDEGARPRLVFDQRVTKECAALAT